MIAQHVRRETDLFGESHVLSPSLAGDLLLSLFFLRRSSTAIISSLFFTVRATRDPLPNYRREDNHPDGLTVSPAVPPSPPPGGCLVLGRGKERKRKRELRSKPCDYNTSIECESRVYDGGESASERGKEDAESFLAKLLTALRISARETLANATGPSVRQSGPRLLCVPQRRGHGKLGVREPRIYEVTFFCARARRTCNRAL